MSRLSAALPRSLGVPHYLAALVLLVRLVVLARMSGSPALLPSGGDMQFYDDWAERISSGVWTDRMAFYGLPLYPYLLAALYSVVGHEPFLPILLQLGLDAGTAAILYLLALRVFADAAGFSRRTAQFIGVFSALAWAVFIPAQVYSLALMPTAFATAAFWFVVYRLARRDSPPPARESLLLGVIIGVSAMAVANVLFLVPLVLSAFFLKNATDLPLVRRTTAALLLAGGVALGTSPAWLHNAAAARDRVFLSAHSGVNLWVGNHPHATGYPSFPAGLGANQAEMLRNSIERAEEAAGYPLPRSEVSRYWSNKARAEIQAQPARWFRLLGIKISNYWNAFQYDDLGVIRRFQEQRITLPGIEFGLVAALGVPSLLLLAWLAPRSRWVSGAIFCQMLSLLPVFVTERYRLPAAAGLILLSVAGLAWVWQRIASGDVVRPGAFVGVVAAWTCLVSVPRTNPSLWALDAYNAGRLALDAGDLHSAERNLQQALAYVPRNAEVNLALGNLRLAQKDILGAKSAYAETLALEPNHQSALNNLAFVALEEGRSAAALGLLQRLLATGGESARTYYLLAKAHLLAGNRDEAKRALDRAIALGNAPEFQELQKEIDKPEALSGEPR